MAACLLFPLWLTSLPPLPHSPPSNAASQAAAAAAPTVDAALASAQPALDAATEAAQNGVQAVADQATALLDKGKGKAAEVRPAPLPFLPHLASPRLASRPGGRWPSSRILRH